MAGNGLAGYNGDGQAATSAWLSAQGIAFDSAGNYYFLDTGNIRVREVNTAGIISTVAGNGTIGLSLLGNLGDGGPATSAALNPSAQPFFQGVAVDQAGNLYISDGANHRVRKVNTLGIISTYAGTGSIGSGGDGGPAANAGIILPTGLAVDSAGNLYIADASGGRVRKVGANGIISTYAGSGTAGFSGDGGPAINAQFNGPTGLAVDAKGNLYIAEFANGAPRVRKVDANGIIATVAGNGTVGFSGDGGPALNAQFAGGLAGLAVDNSGNLYIADYGNFRVRKVDASGIMTTIAGIGPGNATSGVGDGGLPTNAHLQPAGLALDASGSLYVSDAGRVRKIAFGAAPPSLSPSAFSMYFATSTQHTSPPTQILRVSSAGPPLQFSVASTTSSGGAWLSLNTSNLTTPQLMTISIQGPVPIGTYQGALTMTPATPGLAPVTVAVTLVVSATVPASPVITGVVNGASFQPGYALGSVATIQGTNLASRTDNWNSSLAGGHLPASLDGVTVTFNGQPAYISYISPTQINVVTPSDVDATFGSILVVNNGALSSFFSATGTATGPAFFLYDAPGKQVVATHQDYSYAVKAGSFPTLATVAAKPGEVLVLWGTGFGPTTPAALDGAVVPSSQTYSTTTPPTVTVNNVPATVYGAALASGFAGLYQVAIQVPASLADGDWPVQARIGGVQSASGVVLSVKH